MYRPVTPHGDAGSAVEFGDLITIPGGERFHVFAETKEGTALLRPVFDRFTEGLATPDLQAAKSLLDALD